MDSVRATARNIMTSTMAIEMPCETSNPTAARSPMNIACLQDIKIVGTCAAAVGGLAAYSGTAWGWLSALVVSGAAVYIVRYREKQRTKRARNREKQRTKRA
jgi:uncharacterized iron-regulated membrane protein